MSTSVATPNVQPSTTQLSANQIAQQHYGALLVARRRVFDARHVDDQGVPEIVETSERERITLRDAAYMIGVGRAAEASRLRGWV